VSPEATPGTVEAPSRTEPPEWIEGSPLLRQAYALAEAAHRSQQRASDGRPFLDHVTEVGTLLREAGFDVELVATGLLHDAVERGTLSEDTLRAEMPASIGELVLTLSEDPAIESFSERKAALRAQVAAAGGRALTVFAADKLSDIIGLRRGLETFGGAVEERIGTTVSSMAGHYRESVELIESGDPGSAFASELRAELGRLADDITSVVEGAVRV
jgi:hypothetical protein